MAAGIFDGPSNKHLSGRTVVLIFLLIFFHLHDNIVLCWKSQSLPIYGTETKNHRNIASTEILKQDLILYDYKKRKKKMSMSVYDISFCGHDVTFHTSLLLKVPEPTLQADGWRLHQR